MIADPLIMVTFETIEINVTDVNKSLALVDLSPGRTVRAAKAVAATSQSPAGDYTLTLSHSESKENPGQVTDRTANRLECRKTLSDGSQSTAQFTLTGSIPRVGWTQAEARQLAVCLIATLCSAGDGTNDDQYSILSRVIAGEP